MEQADAYSEAPVISRIQKNHEFACPRVFLRVTLLFARRSRANYIPTDACICTSATIIAINSMTTRFPSLGSSPLAERLNAYYPAYSIYNWTLHSGQRNLIGGRFFRQLNTIPWKPVAGRLAPLFLKIGNRVRRVRSGRGTHSPDAASSVQKF